MSPHLGFKNAGYHGSMMNNSMGSNDEMFVLSSQVDYRSSAPVGGLTGYGGISSSPSAYSVYPSDNPPHHQHQHQQRNNANPSRMYFADEMLDENREMKHEPTHNSPYYGN